MLGREVAALQLGVEEGSDDTQQLLADLKVAKTKLKKLEEYKARGWYKRAKVKWAAEGDLPGKFFFGRSRTGVDKRYLHCRTRLARCIVLKRSWWH